MPIKLRNRSKLFIALSKMLIEVKNQKMFCRKESSSGVGKKIKERKDSERNVMLAKTEERNEPEYSLTEGLNQQMR